MDKLELLSPAGSSDKLKTAFYFGADACYFAGKKYGLRAFSDNFDEDELDTYVKYAHSLGKKTYITVNILAHNQDFEGLSEYLQYLYKIGADAIIASDVGIINLARKVAPNLEIHLSTQANCTNIESVKFWKDLGIKRIVLARELSLKEIAEIKDAVPDIDLEAFVHGAMCISYSGRCLLSNYLCKRDSNRGQCAQACRFEYFLREKTRDDEMTIQQDERGTYILNSKDMKMIEHLKEMADAGVSSFKIEGRTKSLYYVSAVAKAYRQAIDAYYKGEKPDEKEMFDQLLKIGNRGYTTGFYLDEQDHEGYSYDVSKGLAGSDFLFEFHDKKEHSDKNLYKVKIKNKILLNDRVEIITPDECFETDVIKIYNDKLDEEKEVGNTNDEIWIELSKEPNNYKYALARTIGIKNVR